MSRDDFAHKGQKQLGCQAGMGLFASVESGKRLRVRVYAEDETGLRLVAVLVSVPGAAHEAVGVLADIFLGREGVVLAQRLGARRPRRDRP